MMREVAPVPAAALPVRALADHLRLGTGFADDGSQDALLEEHLRAALAAVELRTAMAILARDFRLTGRSWRGALPSPATALLSASVRDADGAATDVAARLRIADVDGRSVLEPVGCWPGVPGAGSIELIVTAGFGAWADVPADLRQAVLALAAHFYERRDGALPLPETVLALTAPWRGLRMGAAWS